ncbi:uncharacterized protein Tco_1024450, partial [Tanacetum coccineum]
LSQIPRTHISSRTIVHQNGTPVHSSNVISSNHSDIGCLTYSSTRLDSIPVSLDCVLSVTPQSSVSLSSSRSNALDNGTPVNLSNVSSITQPNRTRSRRSSIRAMLTSRLPNSNISDVDKNTTRYVDYSFFRYWDCGVADHRCQHCQVVLWYEERSVKWYNLHNPKFAVCCGDGKVKIDYMCEPPALLTALYNYNGEQHSKNFRKHIKLIYSMFAFTSTGGRINKDINDGHGSYMFRLNNHNHHHIGTLLPTHVDGHPRFDQLLLVQQLTSMLDSNNVLVKAFRMAKECFLDSSRQLVSIRLLGSKRQDQPHFMALQYPLLFPYGENGFHLNLPLNVPSSWKSSRKNITLREYYAFRLHQRDIENPILHKAGRLFHTYIVYAYTTILDHDLEWYKRNQSTIRSELYNGLHDRITNGETNMEHIGWQVVLPSTFTGGPRYMIQQYHDAMAICRWAGAPDLFVTMTCNPRWIEIARHVKDHIPGQHVNDKPNVITEMFKIKLDEVIKDIMKKHFFGRVKACA